MNQSWHRLKVTLSIESSRGIPIVMASDYSNFTRCGPAQMCFVTRALDGEVDLTLLALPRGSANSLPET